VHIVTAVAAWRQRSGGGSVVAAVQQQRSGSGSLVKVWRWLSNDRALQEAKYHAKVAVINGLPQLDVLPRFSVQHPGCVGRIGAGI
jgi:hypothetical protein